MRLRVAEILAERGMTTYRLAQASGGRISLTTAYRLAKDRWVCLPRDVLDALCDVLSVSPGELFEREKARKGKAK